MRSLEQDLVTRELRRLRSEDRFLTRLESLEEKAKPLVGLLRREGHDVFYINLVDSRGRYTGKTRESHSESELIAYLIRRKYVSIH